MLKCPICGKKADNIHDRRPQSIHDVSFRDKKVTIKIVKKRYSCNHCGKRAIPKNLKIIPGYSRKTERFKVYLLKQTDSRDYSRVARENDLSYTSIKNSVNSQLDTLIKEAQLETLDKVKAISIDEFAIKKKHKYAVALTDPIYRAKGTVKRWEQHIINYFETRITNGFAEGLNSKIKLIKRIGYGVTKVENLKRRVFLSLLSI